MTKKHLRPLIIYALLGGLLIFALHNAPLQEILLTLKKLTACQVLALAALNVLIYALITVRWWLFVRVEYSNVFYLSLLTTRISVFGLSYFTLGPQIGGEPLQVLSLKRMCGMSYARAAATVIMDKLLEFLANFIMLILGAAAIFEAGIVSPSQSGLPVGIVALLLLLALPPTHIALLARGIYPLAAALKNFPRSKFTRFVRAAEWMAGKFCRKHFYTVVLSALASLLASLCMVFEFYLITAFLGISLNVWQSIAAWTAGWLAFLIPLPGGLGALEASQVFALGAFGVSAASAISVTLLIRARDLLIGGLGLALAGRVK
ncbi:MAG: hypothetical protein Fur002_19530 [Anaerolineales bacterium]